MLCLPLRTALVIASLAVLGLGCSERGLRPAAPCTRSPTSIDTWSRGADQVDLLFMIDNSGSMTEEQASLTAELPDLVRVLASGDRRLDGVQDFQPVRSLHIGVITSDMGVGGHDVPTCDGGTFGAMFGDDGVLLTRGRTAIPGCIATYPSIFQFERDRDDPLTFATDVACVANAGVGGCGFEQQLEAVLKAISPSTPQAWTVPGYVPPVFFGSSSGHADRSNMGFVRENSALAIILVTDEEDCSASNPDIFNPGSATFSGTDLNLRCFTYPEATHPVERYIRGVDGHGGLLGLRQNPNLLIFAGIVGVPVETVPDPSAIDYDAILAHPDMMERIDPAMMTRLTPSCNVPGRGIAFPPRRIVRVAQGIEQAGGSATIQSICQAGFEGALDAIIAKIADALGSVCLTRELSADADGLVQCQLFEILPATGETTTCAGLPGRHPARTRTIEVDGMTREICELVQVGLVGRDDGSDGWFYETYDNASPTSTITDECEPFTPQRIAFTGATIPVAGAALRVECLQTVSAPRPDALRIGAPCDPDPDSTDDCRWASTPAHPLRCDAADRSCAVPCESDADCASAALLGDVCDTRSWL
ncbi:MAG: hypothetical protein M3Y87_10590, partial [Myxococcota bacterium]|nr:hypothetical protein [Myxococcota bacterium]